ncbi:hypothetical protein NXY15_05335 [Bacteroides thetaiotaomicron]|nr:hypothetical protein NXY15_05335 [Bacteroides thetaiotaomicron]
MADPISERGVPAMLAVSVPSFRSISGREAVTTTSFSNSVSGCRRMVFCCRQGMICGRYPM